MKSIFTLINNLNNNNYYKIEKFNIKNWDDKEEHKKLIEAFFFNSKKMNIITSFAEDFNLNLNNFDRATHTNSVFFLGCLLYEKLNFNDKINFKRADSPREDEFYFIWFLTSLAHDFGYKIEQNTKNYNNITSDIESFKKYFEINKDCSSLSIFDSDFYTKDRNIYKLIKYIPEYYKKRFNGEVGRTEESRIDHGIASGLILFDRLVKNREIQYKKQNNDLYWGPDLNEFYKIASLAIACHNIRMDPPIKFSQKNDAYLYLFWIVDTIEPTKHFKNCKAQYVLENIIFDFNPPTSFTIENKKGSNLDFSQYITNIEKLKDFLDITIEKEKNKVTLSWV